MNILVTPNAGHRVSYHVPAKISRVREKRPLTNLFRKTKIYEILLEVSEIEGNFYNRVGKTIPFPKKLEFLDYDRILAKKVSGDPVDVYVRYADQIAKFSLDVYPFTFIIENEEAWDD